MEIKSNVNIRRHLCDIGNVATPTTFRTSVQIVRIPDSIKSVQFDSFLTDEANDTLFVEIIHYIDTM